jgi:DNA-directed RNA polymerase subunit K/omega
MKLVEYELVVAAVARTRQLPAPVNVKTAVDEFTVQPVEPALVTEYVSAPLPEVEAKTEGVFGESAVDNAVVGDHETVWADKATVNVTALKLVEYELVVAAVARTTQLPAPVNVKTAVDEFTVQPVEPALVTEYVITPLPEVEAKIEGVFGESAVDNAVVGDHETV